MVEHIYKCDYCGEKVPDQSSFFQKSSSYTKVEDCLKFKSREYDTDFCIVIIGGKEICIPCAKKAIINIGQQFLTDKVTGKEE